MALFLALLKRKNNKSEWVGYFFPSPLIVGLLTVGEIISKINRCINCSESYLGISMSGTTYLVVYTVIAIVLLVGAYRIWYPKASKKE